MVHRTNLAIQTLLNLSLVFHIEGLLQYLYVFFIHNLKRHLEFTKLVEIKETKGNTILQNMKTNWISMISPVKHVLFESHYYNENNIGCTHHSPCSI